MKILFLLLTLVAAAFEQQKPETPVSPLEIVSFKIGNDTNPMLDRKPGTGYSADNPLSPEADAEKAARRSAQVTAARNSSIANSPIRNNSGIEQEDKAKRGRIFSTVVVLDKSEWVILTVHNTSKTRIQSIQWDFPFPRYVGPKLHLRREVFSILDLRPGGKKALKYRLPAGAQRCQVTSTDTKGAEMVCGKGIFDPALMAQEGVSIRKIEFDDGTSWVRQ